MVTKEWGKVLDKFLCSFCLFIEEDILSFRTIYEATLAVGHMHVTKCCVFLEILGVAVPMIMACHAVSIDFRVTFGCVQ